MKFRSTTGYDVHLALTSGHTAVVTVEGNELDARFHKEAIAKGCLPQGVSEDAPVESQAFNRKDVIRKAIQDMLDGANEGDFTAAGKPDLRKLNARVGFTVPRDEADALFEEVSEAE